MSFLDIISIFVVLANLSFGLFVFIKGPKKKANIFFFLLTIAIAGWVYTNWVTYYLIDYKLIDYYGKWLYAFSSLIIPLFFQFVYYFPAKESHKGLSIIKLGLYSSWALGLLFVVLSFFTNYVQDGPIIIRPHLVTVKHGIMFPGFFTFFILFIIWAFIILIKKYFTLGGIERQKIKFVLFGFGIAAFFGTLGNLIFETFIMNMAVRATLSMIGPLFTIFMVASMAYAILRYRLMDIKVVIRKGVVHILSFVILLFIYIYILIYLQKYLTQQYQWPEQTGIIILVLLIVITVEPLRRFLFRIIDQVFYARKKEAREKAKRLKLILSSSLEFDKLINKVKNELQDFLEVEDIQFAWHNKKTGRLENYYEQEKKVVINPTEPLFNYLQERPEIIVTEEIPYLMEEKSASEADVLKNIEKKLNDLGIALIWPVGEKGELIGAFLVGQKAKKEAFTSENLQYLSNIQFQTTMAVANALLYKQAVERIATFK